MTSGMALCGMLIRLTASTMPPMSLSGRRFDSASARFQYISYGISDPGCVFIQRVRGQHDPDDRASSAHGHRLRQGECFSPDCVWKGGFILAVGFPIQVMLLDQGRIAEFDKPATLLADPQSKFHALCQATGKQEFATLKRMASI